MKIDIDKCVEEILDVGHCILRGHFPRKEIEECRKAFLPLLEEVAARIPEGNRGPKRWAIGLPFAPPLYHSAFFNDDTVIQITTRILGEDMHICYYGTDTPTKGSQYQKFHADVPLIFPEDPDHQHPPTTLSVRFTFGAMTMENGPFEVAERSQHLPRADTLEKAESGQIPFAPLLLEAGDVMISDARAVHRGTPNHTDAPRPFAVISHNRNWYFIEEDEQPLEANEDTPTLKESFYQTLSPREKHLLRRVRRTAG